MIQAKHFGSPKIQECMDDIRRQWQQLEDLATFRKQNLQDTQTFFQFQGDADELKAWLTKYLIKPLNYKTKSKAKLNIKTKT
uniref:Uncharacterized protein n=1 Tax=Cyprinodon variegatus TaxID=28743 RepID=A0A3Q2DRP0_CYPVA